MRCANESDDDIAVGGFVEDDFRMAGGDDLRALACSHVGQQLINLALAKNFKMSVRFVEQEDSLRIRVKVSEQQERLLQAAASAGKVKQTACLVPVGHGYFPALFDEFRRLKLGAKQRLDVFGNLLPSRLWLWLFVQLMAKIAEHLRRLTFTEQNVDPPRLPFRFSRRQPRHRW